MSRPASWSEEENRAIVDAYIEMLKSLIAGQPVVKSHVRRRLREGALQARSDRSVEFKFCNLSATLSRLDLPWVEGYKPRENTQKDLEVLLEAIAEQEALLDFIVEQACTQFKKAVAETGLVYDPNFVDAFLLSLATKRFVILTGLSGAGKTQIAMKFGEWLGQEYF